MPHLYVLKNNNKNDCLSCPRLFFLQTFAPPYQIELNCLQAKLHLEINTWKDQVYENKKDNVSFLFFFFSF